MTEIAFRIELPPHPRSSPGPKSYFIVVPLSFKSALSIIHQVFRHLPGLALQVILPVLQGRNWLKSLRQHVIHNQNQKYLRYVYFDLTMQV